MGEIPHVDGLLHLSAFAVIVTAAYIGLDKQERFRAAFSLLAPGMAREFDRTKKIIIALDLMQNEVALLDTLYGVFWLYLICHIAGLKRQKLPLWRELLFFLRRQKHVPLLGYFRSRSDLVIVTIMFLLSLGSFLYLVGTTLEIGAPIDHVTAVVFFGAYIIIVFWILFTLFVLQWTISIESTCGRCYAIIIRNATSVKEKAGKINLDIAP